MLFDIGWPELLLIGVVALVVIGPKDLPRALRTAYLQEFGRYLQTVIEALWRIGPPAKAAVPALTHKAKDKNRLVSETAVSALKEIAPAVAIKVAPR